MITEKDMTLEELEKDYFEGLANFTFGLEYALAISELGKNLEIDSDRQLWCRVLYARMVMVGVSLMLASPYSKLNPVPIQWDACTMATLARNIFEIYVSLEYFCFEAVEPKERQARIDLMYLHDLSARLRIVPPDRQASERHAGLEGKLREFSLKLQENSFFQTLSEKQQSKFLKGRHHFFLSQDEIVGRAKGDVSGLRWLYEKLSSEAHTLPIAFTQVMFKGNSLGAKNDSDMLTAALALHLAKSCFFVTVHKYIVVMGGFCEIDKVIPFPLENLQRNAEASHKIKRERI